ncbi:MAG: hypothetical protein WC710_15270 [Gallionella sp.]|jgi:hypothetical protein
MTKSIYEDSTVCLLSILHPACAFAPGADVARTFSEHSKLDLMDDYEKTDALDFLSNGSFKS